MKSFHSFLIGYCALVVAQDMIAEYLGSDVVVKVVEYQTTVVVVEYQPEPTVSIENQLSDPFVPVNNQPSDPSVPVDNQFPDPYVSIENQTPYPIYTQFYNGDIYWMDVQELLPGVVQTFTILGKAQNVKMAFQPDTTNHPFQFEYTLDGGMIYWDMSAKDGDPFIEYSRSVMPLAPLEGACKYVHCGSGYDGPLCNYLTNHDYDAYAPVCPLIEDTKEPQLHLVIGGT